MAGLVILSLFLPPALSFLVVPLPQAVQATARRSHVCASSTSDDCSLEHLDECALTELLPSVEEDAAKLQSEQSKDRRVYGWLEEACELEQERFQALGSGTESQDQRLAVVNKPTCREKLVLNRIAKLRDAIARTVHEEIKGRGSILATLEARLTSYLNLLCSLRSGAARRARTARRLA